MPHTVRKGSGKRPFKIVNKGTGKTVGSSTSRRKARISASIRDQNSRDVRPKQGARRRRRKK